MYVKSGSFKNLPKHIHISKNDDYVKFDLENMIFTMNYFSNLFKRSFIMNKQEILSYLNNIKPILEKKGIEKIGLFGSFAKDKQNEFSDIDIAFRLKNDFLETYDVWKYFDLRDEIQTLISSKFHKKSELFDLDSTSSLKNIISKEVIYV